MRMVRKALSNLAAAFVIYSIFDFLMVHTILFCSSTMNNKV